MHTQTHTQKTVTPLSLINVYVDFLTKLEIESKCIFKE